MPWGTSAWAGEARLLQARLQQMPVAGFGHPARPCKMVVVNSPGAHGFTDRIDFEQHRNDFAPVGTFLVGDQEAEIKVEMLLVIGG